MHSIRELVINSKDRTSGTPTEFKIAIPAIEGLKRFSLQYVNLPNTLFNIDDTNNAIYYSRGGARGTTIAPGAYSITDLLAELGDAMTLADGLGVYTVSYDPILMAITIECTLAFTLDLSITTNTIWYVLGWEVPLIPGVNTTSALSHTAPYSVRLDFPSELFLTINELGEANVASNSGTRGNFLVPLSVISQFNEIYTKYTRFDAERTYTYGNTLTQFSVKLTKANGDLVDMNGADWSFCLALSY